jgi:hypothetical protein
VFRLCQNGVQILGLAWGRIPRREMQDAKRDEDDRMMNVGKLEIARDPKW